MSSLLSVLSLFSVGILWSPYIEELPMSMDTPQGREMYPESAHSNFKAGPSHSQGGIPASPDSSDSQVGPSDQGSIWTNKPSFKMTMHSGAITCLACSPNGQLIASGSEDHSIIIWYAATGDMKTSCAQHSETVRSVVFSPDSEELASGAENNLVTI